MCAVHYIIPLQSVCHIVHCILPTTTFYTELYIMSFLSLLFLHQAVCCILMSIALHTSDCGILTLHTIVYNCAALQAYRVVRITCMYSLTLTIHYSILHPSSTSYLYNSCSLLIPSLQLSCTCPHPYISPLCLHLHNFSASPVHSSPLHFLSTVHICVPIHSSPLHPYLKLTSAFL